MGFHRDFIWSSFYKWLHSICVVIVDLRSYVINFIALYSSRAFDNLQHTVFLNKLLPNFHPHFALSTWRSYYCCCWTTTISVSILSITMFLKGQYFHAGECTLHVSIQYKSRLQQFFIKKLTNHFGLFLWHILPTLTRFISETNAWKKASLNMLELFF